MLDLTFKSLVGVGSEGGIFSVREQKGVVVKVFYSVREGDARSPMAFLRRELKKAQILEEMDVPVVHHIGIARLRVESHMIETVKSAKLAGVGHSAYINWLLSFLGQQEIVLGLVMEYHPEDYSLVSEKRLKKIYDKEAKKARLKGIEIADSHSGLNVIWDKRQAKLYLIDFTFWDLPQSL